MALTAEINLNQIKGDYHKRVLERLNLEHLDRMPAESARQEVVGLIRSMMALESVPLSLTERDDMVRDLLDEIFGFGPLEVFLRDPMVSDILVNRADQIYVEKKGRLQKTAVVFQDNAHLLR
ncbi:MAG: CpaF family protein, partial [Terriglobales bacterium]